MNPRLSTAFNLQTGEGRPLALFIGYNFFVGLAQVLTQTVAFALFINRARANAGFEPKGIIKSRCQESRL